MITKHDVNIINFIEMLPCYSDTIQKLFYKSQRATNRRLTYLYEYGCIKRHREHASKKYFYWNNRRQPSDKHKNHYDMTARAYIWVLNQGYNIINVEVQKQHGNVTPDLLLHIEREGIENLLPVEVECTNNIWNTVKKYDGSGFKKLLLFSKRSFNRDAGFIEIIDIRLGELE